MKELVSIIVPMYNVEKYIEKCITSLLEQTYKDCEIIIVNDGSEDKSSEIVEKIAIQNDNIKIINQKNSGVSVARNIGIKNANGDYIIFVDADDYLAKDFVEYMVKLIKMNNSEFAYSISNFKKENEKETQDEFIKEISNEESVGLLLSPDVTVGCWNKIYKRDMLIKNNIFFRTDLFYGEGLFFIINVSKYAKNITIGNRKVYYYRRNNENSATTLFKIEKYYNGEKSLNLIGEKINLNNDYIKSMYLLHMSTFYLGAIVKMIGNNKKNEYKKDYKMWKKLLCNNLLYIEKSKYISLYRKTMLVVGAIFPNVVALLDKRRNKRNFKQSV